MLLKIKRKLFHVPKNISANEYREYITSNIVYYACILIHASLIGVFYLLKVYPMSIFNIFSVNIFIINLILNYKGKLVLSHTIAMAEIVLHACLATGFIGLDSNFQYYILSLITANVLVLPSKLGGKTRIVSAVITTAVATCIYIYCKFNPPIYEIDFAVLTVIGTINEFTIGILIITSCYYYYKATEKLKVDFYYSEKLLVNMKEISESIQLNSRKLEQTSYYISQNIKDSSNSMKQIDNSIDCIENATQNNVLNVESIIRGNQESIQQSALISSKGACIKKESETVFETANKGEQIILESINSINNLEKTSNDILSEIKNLDESTKKLHDIMSIISNISSSIKLLSINATIEAAKAGEYSKGFFVVAFEIRKLANKTTEFSNQIQSILKNFTHKSENLLLSGHKNIEVVNISANKVLEVNNMFKSILTTVTSSQENVGTITEASEIHALISENISDSIRQTSISSNNIAASVNDISKASKNQLDVLNKIDDICQELNNVSKELNEKVIQAESLFNVNKRFI